MARNFMQTDCPACGQARMKGGHFTYGCAMTQEVWDALKRYAAAHGRYWKRHLTDAWAADRLAVARKADRGLLQQARNIVGPSGLYKLLLDTPEPRPGRNPHRRNRR